MGAAIAEFLKQPTFTTVVVIVSVFVLYFALKNSMESIVSDRARKQDAISERLLHSFRTQHSYLYQKRAETMEKLYELLVSSQHVMKQLTAKVRPLTEEQDDRNDNAEELAVAASAVKELRNLETFYLEKRLFLSDKLDKATESFVESLWKAYGSKSASGARRKEWEERRIRLRNRNISGVHTLDHEEDLVQQLAGLMISNENSAYELVYSKADELLDSIRIEMREFYGNLEEA